MYQRMSRETEDATSEVTSSGSHPPHDVESGRQSDLELLNSDERSDLELWLSDHFEPPFFKLRFLLIIPVFLSLLGAVMMFMVGANHIYKAGASIILRSDFSNPAVTLPIIKALDAFLIGIILIIFAFGIYDFFVSILEPAHHAGLRPDWFKFETTGELKTKLVELVLVILAILFFEQIIANVGNFDDPFVYLTIPLGAAILAVSIGFFKWATH